MKPGENMSRQPDLSIVIVNWNTRAMLADCLASIEASGTESKLEIFVVDNGSSDGSPEMVEADFPHVRLIRNGQNRGFAAANNQAIRHAGGRHVLLLNSDTIVHPGVLDGSVQYMDVNENVGIMGCRVLNADGTVQPSCSQFPTLANLLILASGMFRIRGFTAAQRYRMDEWQRDAERDVDVISGCYLLVRGDAIPSVGLLDEAFFFFGEETDWCRRFREAGFVVRFAPVGTIVHFGGGSSKSLNFRRDLMLSEATVRLHRKHGGPAAAAAAWVILLLFNASRFAYWQARSLLFHRRHERAEHFRGVLHGFRQAWPGAAK
jgi:GT2 family glycosyltransferase